MEADDGDDDSADASDVVDADAEACVEAGNFLTDVPAADSVSAVVGIALDSALGGKE